MTADGTPTVFTLHCRDAREATAGMDRVLPLIRSEIRPAATAAGAAAPVSSRISASA